MSSTVPVVFVVTEDRSFGERGSLSDVIDPMRPLRDVVLRSLHDRVAQRVLPSSMLTSEMSASLDALVRPPSAVSPGVSLREFARIARESS